MPDFITCTPTEIRVLTELVKDGAENALIGRRLHISMDTVKCHLQRINRRAKAFNRTDLALKLARKEIVVVNSDGQAHEF